MSAGRTSGKQPTVNRTPNPSPVTPECPSMRPPGQLFRAVVSVRGDAKHQKAVADAPSGLPAGPILGDVEHLRSAVKEYASDLTTAGGGWWIRFCGGVPPTSNTGYCKKVGCGQKNAEGVLCKWECRYEQTSDGWMLLNFRTDDPNDVTGNGHNHPLKQSGVEVMASRGGEFVPGELAHIAEAMAAANSPAAAIHKVLVANAARMKVDVTWKSTTIYDWYVRSRVDGSVDMTDMVQLLAQRKEEDGYYSASKFESHEDNSFTLSRVFVELDHGMPEYARGGNFNIILFDPVHGTNKHKLKLSCFVTIGSTGQTVILALVLIDLEDTVAITWAFKCFHECFKRAPAIVMTDSGASIIAGVEKMIESGLWQHVLHLLCIFHLSKNFFEKISPIIPDRKVFHELTNIFWSIAKETDTTSRDSFGEDWELFCSKFEDAAADAGNSDGPKATSARDFLNKLGSPDFCKKWSYRFTCASPTFLIHSTQRSEAVNSAVKQCVSTANMKATVLLSGLITYNLLSRDVRAADSIRLHLRQLKSAATFPPWITRLQDQVTPFAYDLILSQYSLACRYTMRQETSSESINAATVFLVKPYAEDEDLMAGEVTVSATSISDASGGLEDFGLRERSATGRRTTATWCSCQFDICSGLDVCRHRICVIESLKAFQINPAEMIGVNIAQKWLLIDSAEEASLVAALRRTELCAPRRNYVPSVASSRVMPRTPAERFTLMQGEMRALASSAEVTDSLTDKVQSLVHEMHTMLSCGKLLEAVLTRAPDEETEVRQPRASSGREDDPEAEAVVQRTPDQISLEKAISGDWVIDETEMTSENSTEVWYDLRASANSAASPLQGRTIAYKWNHRNAKGWFVCQLVEHNIDSNEQPDCNYLSHKTINNETFCGYANFKAKFCKDGKDAQILIIAASRLTFNPDKAPQASWVLLAEAPLDQSSDLRPGSTIHPPKANASGRNGAKRLRPLGAVPTGTHFHGQHGRGARTES